jgi:hypothetical protein
MFHYEIVGMFMIYLRIKFRLPIGSGWLVIAPSRMVHASDLSVMFHY